MIRHLLALAAMCLAVPAAAQTVSGCGTTAIPKASLNSTAKLTGEATCFSKARDTAAAAVTARQARITALTPATPVKTPPVVITTPTADTPAPVAPKLQIGMNLSPVVPNSPAHPFIDRAKYVQWRSNEWGDLPAGSTDANGAPNQPGTSYKTSFDLEAGSYVILYTGSPAVSIYQAEQQPGVAANVVTWGPGVTSIDYSTPGRILFTAAGGSATFQISDINPADKLRDLHIVRVDQEAAWRAGGIINPEYAAFLKPFSPYRMMDWSGTNGSSVTHWSDRSLLSTAYWGTVPYEAEIALANLNGADLWLNVPAHADDDYVLQLATLVKAQLSPGLKLHLEYSNEVWNSSFEQSKWAQAQADAAWGNGSSVYFGMSQFYGYRAAQVMSIAKGVLGDRLVGVVGTWPGWGNSDVDDAIGIGVAKAGKGSIASLFGEYAVTTYFGNKLSYGIGNEPDRPVTLAWANGGAAGITSALAEVEHGKLLPTDAADGGAGSLDAVARGYVRHAAQAKAWGLNMVAYEGGIHVFNFMAPESEKPVRVGLLCALVADPRFKVTYARMPSDFAAAGGTTLMQFSDVGDCSQWGSWGVVPDLKSTSPRLEVLKAASGR